MRMVSFENSLSKDPNYRRILKGIQNRKREILLTGIGRGTSIEALVRAVSFDHPELFFVDMTHIAYSDITVGVLLRPAYLFSLGDQQNADIQLQSQVRNAIRTMGILPHESVLSIYRKIHNYLISSVTYDFNALARPNADLHVYSAYGALVNHRAVCEGISKAFKLLCAEAGVPSILISGYASEKNFGENLPHVWNLVELNGEFAHIDVTWDLGISQSCSFTRYDYFMVPDEWVQRDHRFQSVYPCCTSAYSAFLQKGRQFSSPTALKSYIVHAIANHQKILYFRVDSKKDREYIVQSTERYVKAFLSENMTGAFTVTEVSNETQSIFFFRITM